jgi:hypothetical protein
VTLDAPGPDRKELHQGEEYCPPHREWDEDTDDPVSHEGSGSASLVKEGRKETREDIENGHAEDVDQPEAHVEESRDRTVLPRPAAICGVGHGRMQIDSEQHHHAAERIQGMVAGRVLMYSLGRMKSDAHAVAVQWRIAGRRRTGV